MAIRIALLASALCGVAVLPYVGCESTEPESSLPDPLATHELQADSKLQQALNFVNRLDEFELSTAHDEIRKNLQEWMSEQQLDPSWKPDGLSQQLPESFLPMVALDRLTKNQFELYDAIVLQEATWLRDVARSVEQYNQPPPEIAALTSQITESHKADTAADLVRAVRLFDWTVRNLQLDADVRIGEASRFGSDVILHAWESLLFGRGTLAEKSRVFILLCRQVDIPAVMLAIAPETSDGELKLWLPAVLVGGQLYLFDVRLGTAVPGPERAGVASLLQVQENPELLAALAPSDEGDRVTADELARVIALMDATPPELSQRMQHLESALVGPQKLVLTTSPSQLVERLRGSGVDVVGIWPLPYESFMVRGRLQQDPAGLVQLMREHSLFDGRTPLARARILHLRGQYDAQEDRPGARALYLDCRTSEQQIEAVAHVPLQLGEGDQQVTPTQEQRNAHRARLLALQEIMHRAKEHATYWIALMSYDRGEYGVSIDYLEKRLLPISPDTQWLAGATYNLARAYEARGRTTGQADDLRRAQELYASQTNSPNAAACQWRAGQLERELSPSP